MTPDGTDEIAAATPPSILKAAGGLSLGAGATALLVVVQAFSGFVVPGSAMIWLGVVGVLGVATSASGLGLLRGRAWAGIGGAISGVLLMLVSGAWLVRATLGGFFSLFAVVDPWLAAAGAVCTFIGLGALKRVTDARERLRAEGLDLGT